MRGAPSQPPLRWCWRRGLWQGRRNGGSGFGYDGGSGNGEGSAGGSGSVSGSRCGCGFCGSETESGTWSETWSGTCNARTEQTVTNKTGRLNCSNTFRYCGQ